MSWWGSGEVEEKVVSALGRSPEQRPLMPQKPVAAAARHGGTGSVQTGDGGATRGSPKGSGEQLQEF